MSAVSQGKLRVYRETLQRLTPHDRELINSIVAAYRSEAGDRRIELRDAEREIDRLEDQLESMGATL